jgi:hypothetical protein
LRVYVVDASVAARFPLVEEFSDKAEWLLQRFHDDAVELGWAFRCCGSTRIHPSVEA